MNGFVISLSCAMSVGLNSDAPRCQPPPTIEWVRNLASCNEQLCHLALLEYRAAAFPAYRVILDDPGSDQKEVAGVLSALIFVQAPKAQFRERAVRYLTSKDRWVRYTAAGVIREIGTQAEGAILVALLSDEEAQVSIAAACALARVGGPRDLIAMDVWLRTGLAYREVPHHLKHVEECRDLLDHRLKGNFLAPQPREVKP